MKAGSTLYLMLGASLTLLSCIGGARAQSAGDGPAAQALGGQSGPGASGAPGGSSGFGHHSGHNAQGNGEGASGSMPELKPTVRPRQRLDAGALLCHTEAQLRQHQAAMMARLAGKPAQEAGGCHVIGETEAVSVLVRDGQAATQVEVSGDELSTGWTDAVIRDSDPLHGPMKLEQ